MTAERHGALKGSSGAKARGEKVVGALQAQVTLWEKERRQYIKTRQNAKNRAAKRAAAEGASKEVEKAPN